MELLEKNSKLFFRKQLQSEFLAKIKEKPKQNLEQKSVKIKSRSLKRYAQSGRNLSIKNTSSPSENILYCIQWLKKLSQHKLIYSNFLHACFHQKLLTPLRPPTKKSCRKIIQSRTPEPLQVSSEKTINQILPIKNCKKTKKYKFNGLIIERSPIIPKDKVMHQYSSEVYHKFKEIVGKSSNATKDNINNYLLARYPAEICEQLLRWVYSGISTSYDKWVFEIQKFIGLPKEKHYKLAFDLFDFNKDKFICNSDAFTVLLLDKELFSQDILKIHSEFLLKVQNTTYEIPSQKAISLKDQLKNLNFGVKNKAKCFLKGHPEALDFEDFLKIEFVNDRPQIVLDVIKYISGIDTINKKQHDLEEKIVRKNSEDLVKIMMENQTMKEYMILDKKFKYLIKLESIMNELSYEKSIILLEKFYFMCSDRETGLLTLQSINKFWPRIFGVENNFISTSFYNFLVSKKTTGISKLRFLKKIKKIFDDEDFFAFSIYNKNKDGWISCVEITEFFNSLIEDSYMLKECTIIVNEFVASIYEKKVNCFDKIDFQVFKNFIPKSLLVNEFIQCLLLPIDTDRKNLAFTAIDKLDNSEIEKLQQYKHLQGSVGFGEFTFEQN